MIRFKHQDIYIPDGNLSFKFSHGTLKALSEDSALFISESEVIDVHWKINNNGFLILMFPKGKVERYLINNIKDDIWSLTPLKKNTNTGKYKKFKSILVKRLIEDNSRLLKKGIIHTIKNTHRSVFLMLLINYCLQFITLFILNKSFNVIDFSTSTIFILSNIIFFVLIKNYFDLSNKLFNINKDFFIKNL